MYPPLSLHRPDRFRWISNAPQWDPGSPLRMAAAGSLLLLAVMGVLHHLGVSPSPAWAARPVPAWTQSPWLFLVMLALYLLTCGVKAWFALEIARSEPPRGWVRWAIFTVMPLLPALAAAAWAAEGRWAAGAVIILTVWLSGMGYIGYAVRRWPHASRRACLFELTLLIALYNVLPGLAAQALGWPSPFVL